jgi:hypothetical protein
MVTATGGLWRRGTAVTLLAGLGGLLVPSTAGAQPASSGAVSASGATVIRQVSPVDADGALLPGYTIAHRYSGAGCQRGSALTGTAYRCATSRAPQGVLDPCWVTQTSERVVCLDEPWRHRVVRLTVDGGYDSKAEFGHQPSPWGVRLASKQRCLLHPASVESVNGRPVRYYCTKRVVLAGRFDRSTRTWRIRAYRNTTPHAEQPTYRSLGRARVVTAWRGSPSRTD